MTRVAAARRSRRQRGQTMIEFALVLPVMLALFIGVSTTANFLADRQVVGQAARAGARLAAEDGNAGYTASGPATAACQGGTNTNPCQVDQEVINNVLAVVASLSASSVITEIDIYEPCAYPGQACSGSGPDTEVCSYSASGLSGSVQSGDPVDVYVPNGSGGFKLQEPGGDTEYTLNLRDQQHPDELPVGVRVVSKFTSPTPLTMFNSTTSQYATMCMAPEESGG